VHQATAALESDVIANSLSDEKILPTPFRGMSRTRITPVKIKYRPDNLDYKCFCVKPILEDELTKDGVTYKVRYQLCGLGSCAKVDVEVLDPNGKHHEIKCTGNCAGECKCTLFRLQVAGGGGFKPENAKWNLIAKADTQVNHDDRYIYRCCCVK
jgi:hypothetical protein